MKGVKQTFPESAMNRMPSIVIDVSAIFVETMHFLTPSGAMSNTFKHKGFHQLHLLSNFKVFKIEIKWRKKVELSG